MRTFSALILSASVAVSASQMGCAGHARPFRGEPSNVWIGRWGPPDEVTERNDGGRVSTWKTEYFGSLFKVFTCRQSLRVDADGKYVDCGERDCGRWL